MAELGGDALPLCSIARVATERQIGHPIGATSTARLDVIQLKGSLPAPAVGTRAPELLQEIGSHFPAGQFATLVRDA